MGAKIKVRDHAGQLVITRDLTLETNGVIIHDHKFGSFGLLQNIGLT